ncbi:MAG: DUF1273 family protein [Clostridia bacterium]|nr:DUF1273 family protein [Clostridia bacterium]
MTESERRMRRCCFTGHRPEKMSWTEAYVKVWLEDNIRKAIDDGFTTFITGMARGTDIWTAEIVIRLRASNPQLHLIAASPYEGFERSWSMEWQQAYKEILSVADLVRFVCPRYSRECFQIRNEWMVDHSARVIAVYNGQPSGTGNTVRYALASGVETIIIE